METKLPELLLSMVALKVCQKKLLEATCVFAVQVTH